VGTRMTSLVTNRCTPTQLMTVKGTKSRPSLGPFRCPHKRISECRTLAHRAPALTGASLKRSASPERGRPSIAVASCVLAIPARFFSSHTVAGIPPTDLGLYRITGNTS